jgi:uncharacterized membrane protein
MKNILNNLKNQGTIIAIVGYVLSILTALGITVDGTAVKTVAISVCSIGVLLGILNNPTTPGVSTDKGVPEKDIVINSAALTNGEVAETAAKDINKTDIIQ